ncbi:flagellar hook protein FlgE [Cohaesibacter gelatinilyticus]|uniref:Flagellar hook protein FlgE n=1 Tax=Cohaesibacter gelatinilyticus TaxID=372072 RepID=A0A285NMK7_9HYPH|nr:flagellar hook-basal body complex protein [Cohaesibacter gelatinilyticus]SNZ08871.1 flagellar hook protein FlgE [Cohaesibacter gelatinilyticus]HAT87765.1 flagellar hook-basal body complex protein [Hyphomicrobiales bacterium]
MGLFAALNASVSGLRAQSNALENISGNIANSRTTGFKRVDTSFVDLVSNSNTSINAQRSGAVLSNSRQTNTVSGVVQRSDTGTHMAISGDGYFVVQKKIGEADGRPILEEVPYYTRRGDFSLDKDGYLVNGAGYYLNTIELDDTTGNPVGSVPTVLRVDNDFMEADATTEITYKGNLASYPQTTNADKNVVGSELMNPANYTNDPTVGGAGFVQAADETRFLADSIAGGAITAYTANGSTASVQMRWSKTSTSPDTWNLFYLTDSTATGANAKWRNVGQNYIFNATGELNPPLASVTVTSLTIDGVNLGNISLNHGGDGMTQFSNSNGNAKVNISQNGAAAGELLDVKISDTGKIVASYSNSKTRNIAEIPLASFNGDNYLARQDGGVFRQTEESGQAILGATGSIEGSATEASNTDIAEEFSKMIVTQQAYSANTRVLTTSKDMLQEIMQVIR